MKRFTIASISYLNTGIGAYHTFFSDSLVYGSIILSIGLVGVLFDVFRKKLNME